MQFPMPKPEQALPKEEAQDGLPMTVGIGMLKSYERMGMVNVACTEGCSCQPRKFDLHHEEQASTCRNCFAHYSLLYYFNSVIRSGNVHHAHMHISCSLPCTIESKFAFQKSSPAGLF